MKTPANEHTDKKNTNNNLKKFKVAHFCPNFVMRILKHKQGKCITPTQNSYGLIVQCGHKLHSVEKNLNPLLHHVFILAYFTKFYNLFKCFPNILFTFSISHYLATPEDTDFFVGQFRDFGAVFHHRFFNSIMKSFQFYM